MKTYNLIIFQIGPEYFVLEIDRMLQIIRYAVPRSLPNAPRFVEGILIWEGMVIPVVNLQSRLYPDLGVEPAKPKIFIIRLDSLNVGFKIGNVYKLIHVEESHVLPPPPALGGMVVDYIKGVIQHEGKVYLFLDLEKTLSQEEKKVLKDVNLKDKAGVKK
jgi:purine-binding chemotaxis protein CheW